MAPDRKKLDSLLIGGKPLPCPDADVICNEEDLDSEDTGRDEQGYMHRLVLRRAVKTWEFPYAALSKADYNYIRSLVAEPTFPVSFWGTETTAYCAKSSATLLNAATGEYRNFKLKIIEC